MSRPGDVSKLLICGTWPSRTFCPKKAIIGVLAIASEREKGVGRGELSCLSGFEGHSTCLLIFYESVSRGGWPAKGVVSSAPRTVRWRLGRRMSMSVNKIQFGFVYWKTVVSVLCSRHTRRLPRARFLLRAGDTLTSILLLLGVSWLYIRNWYVLFILYCIVLFTFHKSYKDVEIVIYD
jgi:hypothetical protein